MNINIVSYSEKALAIFGDTKTIKDVLKANHCKFNPFLTNPTTGNKEPGWIAAKIHEPKLRELLENFAPKIPSTAEVKIPTASPIVVQKATPKPEQQPKRQINPIPQPVNWTLPKPPQNLN